MVPKPPQATKGTEFPFGNPFTSPVRVGRAGNGNFGKSPLTSISLCELYGWTASKFADIPLKTRLFSKILNLIFTSEKGFVLRGGLGEEFSPSRSGVWGDCGTPHVFGTFSKKVQRKTRGHISAANQKGKIDFFLFFLIAQA